jgi:peptide/nickel transport system substrate-binding protein
MRVQFRVRLIAAVLVLVLIAAACGDDGGEAGSGTTPTGPTTTAEPKAGGNLVHGVYSETAGLDPVVTNGGGTTGNTELSSIYDVIMRYDPESARYEPQTAESLTPNAEFTEWTLKLRSGIKFSDGTDYDAEAVVFGMKRHSQFGSRAAGLLANVQEYTVVDPLTVRFTLRGPWPGFPYVLAFTPGLIPSPTAVKAACGANHETLPRECSFNLRPVGAGPFVLDSYRPRDSITVKRNPNYWGGQVYLDTVRFVNLNGAPPTYEAIKANTLQTGFLRETETIKRAQDEGSLGGSYVNMQWAGGVALMNSGKVTCRGGNPAALCGGKPDGVIELTTPTADRRVRQAIALAVDPKVIDQRLNNNTGFPSAEFFQEPSRWRSSSPTKEYDVNRAKALVEEVKRETGWDGSIRLNCHNAPSVQGWPIAMQAMLTNAGFRPVLKNDYDINGLVADVLINKSYDVSCWGLNVAEEAPEIALQQVLLSTSSGNAMNFHNAEIDAQIKIVREARTDAEKKAALDRIQEIWKVEQPSVVWGAVPEMIAWRRDVHGLKMTVSTTVLFDKAWIG